MDPLIDWILRAGLAVLFAAAAVHKGRDVAGFSQIFAEYQLVPTRLVPICVRLLIGAEMLAALLLLVPALRAVAAPSAIALLIVYSLAIAINLQRGRREIDCGCLGPSHHQPISGWLLVRNAILGSAALLACLAPGGRTLGVVDVISLVAGLGALVLLFIAANQLAGQAYRIETTRMSARRLS
jgi:hypothetical protein